MNVGSLESSNWCNFLSFQITEISLLDYVKGLIEVYNTQSNSEENIIFSAKLVIEKVNKLTDIGVKRECLCRLLKLEIEEVQILIIEEIGAFFNFTTFLYDIQHDQSQQLMHLEVIISEIIESKLNLSQVNFLFPICMIYQDILEHLWLLPYLEFGNRCSNLLIQNKDSILSNMKRWVANLYQLVSEEKIQPFIPKNVEKSVLRLFETLPESILEDINMQKSIINKGREVPANFLTVMAEFYRSQGDFPRAILHTKAFLEIFTQKIPKRSEKKESLVRIMELHGKLADWNQLIGRYPRAIFHGTEALKVAQELHHPYAIMICLKNIGSLYVAQGRGELALPFYQEAQSITQILKEPEVESQILIELAKVYLSIGKNDDAIQCYQVALNLTKEKSKQALLYTGIGRAHANAQNYPLAKEAYQNALKIIPRDEFLKEIQIYGGLAELFNNIGLYGTAIFHAEKALELTQHLSIQIDEIQALDSKFRALTALGKIYDNVGDYEKGFDRHTQALKFAKKLKLLKNPDELESFSDSLGTVYMNIGSAYCNLKNYRKGAEFYIKGLKKIKNGYTRGLALLNLGNIHFLSDTLLTKSINYYKEANEIDNKEIRKNSLISLGTYYDAMENKEIAIQSIKESICLSHASEDRRSEAIGYHNLGEVYRKFDHSLAEVNYRKSVDVYAKLHQELKNYSRWQITFFELQAMPLLRLESLLLEEGKTKEALQIADFRRSRALISSLTEKFQFQKNDNLLSSGLTSQEMQALAYKMNTCFILYSLPFESTDSITAWIIPSHGEILCKPLPLGILTEEVKEPDKLFQTFPFIAEARTGKSPLSSFIEELTRGEPEQNINLSNSQTFKKRLKNWYEILIAPIASYLPKDPQQVVTIIPDGYLAQIPFAAFLDKEGNYLIEKHPLSIAPSIQALTLLDQLPKDFSKNSLVIGNPNTSGSQLKFAEKEAQAIVAPLLETAPEKVFLQDNATVRSVVEGMADARWIHLACHGSIGKKPGEKLDPHSVFEGLFKLTPDESHPQGYLHAQEIAVLALRAELIFMSACFSGRGKSHKEGIVGPVWSFLAAGALSTVATYWRLPDTKLTLQMVETFYRQFLGIGEEKLNKAQALQKAILVGIEQARERPDRWGAFFLSGLYE
ncbi:Uncharacterized protein PRO82_000511 [Candidatus Protochlamydia amoebophila]|uniref:CHAT domain-containing tetratricopeptide repeat protein n=1 Tax=Candidatus Protochlamydia amoebophila TaxID=362787 RepID=UPI001BCA35D9|nr:CHAT domain-containing tetratricopeptide repeat protein [Candidatus Protochlamydia amoebophila]MBS4163213.1 Uncharacterized protein [Candidatus Protochlamydia amoebophila]